jgi:hypothetical protein
MEPAILSVPSLDEAAPAVRSLRESADIIQPKHRAVSDKKFWQEFWREPATKTCRVVAVLVSDLVMAIFILGCVGALHQVYRIINEGQDILLWGRIPLSWLFDSLEFGAIILFILYGLVDLYRALRGAQNHDAL